MMISAHQPQFAPWLGFFEKMDRADAFVFLDDVQFKKNEWQNRNRIKGTSGLQWLTVPVSFRFGHTIREVAISHRQDWRRRHLATLRTCYGRAPHFEEVLAVYEGVIGGQWNKLADLNLALLREISGRLGITTPVHLSSELGMSANDRDARLIELCRKLGAHSYLAGEGGRAYMSLDRYQDAGIRVVFQRFEHPTYPQLFGDFSPRLSILDLLFNCGRDALTIVRTGRTGEDDAA